MAEISNRLDLPLNLSGPLYSNLKLEKIIKTTSQGCWNTVTGSELVSLLPPFSPLPSHSTYFYSVHKWPKWSINTVFLNLWTCDWISYLLFYHLRHTQMPGFSDSQYCLTDIYQFLRCTFWVSLFPHHKIIGLKRKTKMSTPGFSEAIIT